MTTREAIETAVAAYGKVGRSDLPRWLRQPASEDELNLSIAVFTASNPAVKPLYDGNGVLTGWRGIRLSS